MNTKTKPLTNEEKIKEIKRVVAEHKKKTGFVLEWEDLSKRRFRTFLSGGIKSYIDHFSERVVVCTKEYLGNDLGTMNVEYEEFNDNGLNRIYSAMMKKDKAEK